MDATGPLSLGRKALSLSLCKSVDFPTTKTPSTNLDSRNRQHGINQMGCSAWLSVCLFSGADGYGGTLVRHLSRDRAGKRSHRHSRQSRLYDWMFCRRQRHRGTQVIRALSVAHPDLAERANPLLHAAGDDDQGYHLDPFWRVRHQETQTGLSDVD